MTPHERAKAGSEQAPVLAPLTVLVTCALLVLAQLYLAIPLAPVISEALGEDETAAAAALGTTYALAYGLGFLIFGPLSDRYGRKPILVPGMAVLAVATAGLAAVSSLSMVAVLRTIQGFVAASFSAAAFPVILSFVAMYAALGPLLQTQFGLDRHTAGTTRRAASHAVGSGCRLAGRTTRLDPGSHRGISPRRSGAGS